MISQQNMQQSIVSTMSISQLASVKRETYTHTEAVIAGVPAEGDFLFQANKKIIIKMNV